jgi:hypothetical protein
MMTAGPVGHIGDPSQQRIQEKDGQKGCVMNPLKIRHAAVKGGPLEIDWWKTWKLQRAPVEVKFLEKLFDEG